jgi:hypothetical protein
MTLSPYMTATVGHIHRYGNASADTGIGSQGGAGSGPAGGGTAPVGRFARRRHFFRAEQIIPVTSTYYRV